MAEKKWTIGREYLTETCFSEQDFEFMEKDRGTHSSDLFSGVPPKGYSPYSQREPVELLALSTVLTAEVNFQYRNALKYFITDVCEMTQGRPFDNCYFDVKLYRDKIETNQFYIFVFIIVSVNGDDTLDTLSREHIKGLFAPDHYNEAVNSYSLSMGLRNFQNTFFFDQFEKESAYALIYDALEMDRGEMFYHKMITDVEALPEDKFREISNGFAWAQSEKIVSTFQGSDYQFLEFGPFLSFDEVNTTTVQESILGELIKLLELYRIAFGLPQYHEKISPDTLIINLFDHDVGCMILFLTQTYNLYTSMITGHSRFQTVREFAESIIEGFEISHEFENIWEEEDFDPRLTIELPVETLDEQLRGAERFFKSEFRNDPQIFLSMLDDWRDYEMISPWLVVSEKVRSNLEVVGKLVSNFLLDDSYPYLTDDLKDRINQIKNNLTEELDK